MFLFIGISRALKILKSVNNILMISSTFFPYRYLYIFRALCVYHMNNELPLPRYNFVMNTDKTHRYYTYSTSNFKSTHLFFWGKKNQTKIFILYSPIQLFLSSLTVIRSKQSEIEKKYESHLFSDTMTLRLSTLNTSQIHCVFPYLMGIFDVLSCQNKKRVAVRIH